MLTYPCLLPNENNISHKKLYFSDLSPDVSCIHFLFVHQLHVLYPVRMIKIVVCRIHTLNFNCYLQNLMLV